MGFKSNLLFSAIMVSLCKLSPVRFMQIGTCLCRELLHLFVVDPYPSSLVFFYPIWFWTALVFLSPVRWMVLYRLCKEEKRDLHFSFFISLILFISRWLHKGGWVASTPSGYDVAAYVPFILMFYLFIYFYWYLAFITFVNKPRQWTYPTRLPRPSFPTTRSL